jgi:hypothetical protein
MVGMQSKQSPEGRGKQADPICSRSDRRQPKTTEGPRKEKTRHWTATHGKMKKT